MPVTIDGTNGITSAVLTTPTITNYTETTFAPAASTAFTVNLTNGTVQKLTTNGTTTITLPASVAGKSYIIIVAYGGSHALTITGGSTLKWPNGVTPIYTSALNKFDIFSFFCDGTNTYGAVIGQNY